MPSRVVVVDQSTMAAAATLDVVRSLRQRLGGPEDRVVHLPSTGGMARGQNDGLSQITEDVVLVTDDDCVPARDWVAVASATLAARPALGLVGGRVLPLEPTADAPYAVSSRPSTTGADLDATSDPWHLGSGNNFAVRRQVIAAVGGNDERLGPGARFGGGADMDLFRRIMRTGVPCRYEPAMLVHHARATALQHRHRRVPYGYGIGIAGALWWRQGDRRAPAIVGRYVAMRLRRIRRGLRSRNLRAVRDEALILWGTAGGVLRGLTLTDPAPPVRAQRA